MKPNYHISEITLSKVKELPGSWTKADYLNMLEKFGVDDTDSLSENDMHEMLVMALQDAGLVDSAEALLEYRLGKVLDEGDRQHTAEDFLHAELWDEHADITLHKELFNIGVLLHDSFSNRMTEPVCAHIKLKISPYDKESLDDLKKGDISSLVMRIIADGMDENAKLNRLYEDQILKGPFPEASSIIWNINSSITNDGETDVAIADFYLSYEWVKDFPLNDNYDSAAFADN